MFSADEPEIAGGGTSKIVADERSWVGGVDDALVGTGWEPLLAYRPRHRLEKNGFKLIFSS